MYCRLDGFTDKRGDTTSSTMVSGDRNKTTTTVVISRLRSVILENYGRQVLCGKITPLDIEEGVTGQKQ